MPSSSAPLDGFEHTRLSAVSVKPTLAICTLLTMSVELTFVKAAPAVTDELVMVELRASTAKVPLPEEMAP